MQPGDHIYIHCVGYTHHGIYCGDDTAIHYSGEKLKGIISQTSITSFASGKEVCVQKYGSCDSPDIVIARAKSKLGESGYNLFDNNCEHFATWCKTGRKRSEQVTQKKSQATGVGGSTAAVVGGIGVVSATGAAGLSGAGIMSGLATVGGIVGGGAVAGVGVLAAAPALITTAAMSQVFKEDESLPAQENEARRVGQAVTTATAVAGTVGAAGAIATAGSVAGLSAAGITSGLAAIGGVVGGGMVMGVAITAAAPAAAAATVGFGAYSVWKWLSE
jgi:hypothetical protein